MRESFMHDLYFGNFIPWERGFVQDPEYRSIIQKISDINAHFKGLLPPDEYKKLAKMEELQAQSGTIEDVNLFEYGFCMATLMMMDVLKFKERPRSEPEYE